MSRIFSMLGDQGFGSYSFEGGAWVKVDAAPSGILCPGFVDIHIHGAYGIDFMSASADDMRHLSKRLRADGYEAYLPTTITASKDEILWAIGNLPEDDPMIPGFHLEGPFISKEYPGAQPLEAISKVPIGSNDWDEVLDHPKLKLVTLAPELPGALELILRLRKRGVLASMGHTNATFEEARRGFEFGATHTTHTFNAMRGFHHREAGMAGYALAQDGLFTELIYDRIHVCKDSAQVLFKSKPGDKVLAVSDSTAATGLAPGTALNMWGHDVEVGRGEVRLASNQALAGSASNLLQIFQNLAEDFGPETAIQACCHNPRKALGLKGEPSCYIEWSFDFEFVKVHSLHDLIN